MKCWVLDSCVMSKEIENNHPFPKRADLLWLTHYVLRQITWSNCTVEPIITSWFSCMMGKRETLGTKPRPPISSCSHHIPRQATSFVFQPLPVLYNRTKHSQNFFICYISLQFFGRRGVGRWNNLFLENENIVIPSQVSLKRAPSKFVNTKMLK